MFTPSPPSLCRPRSLSTTAVRLQPRFQLCWFLSWLIAPQVSYSTLYHRIAVLCCCCCCCATHARSIVCNYDAKEKWNLCMIYGCAGMCGSGSTSISQMREAQLKLMRTASWIAVQSELAYRCLPDRRHTSGRVKQVQCGKLVF